MSISLWRLDLPFLPQISLSDSQKWPPRSFPQRLWHGISFLTRISCPFLVSGILKQSTQGRFGFTLDGKWKFGSVFGAVSSCWSHRSCESIPSMYSTKLTTLRRFVILLRVSSICMSQSHPLYMEISKGWWLCCIIRRYLPDWPDIFDRPIFLLPLVILLA